MKILLLLLMVLVGSARAAGFAPGEHKNLPLNDLSPTADALAIAQRTLTPITHDRLLRFLESHTETKVQGQSILAGKEKWGMYVPRQQPAEGYGLLVWIAPMPIFSLPDDWRDVLDEKGLVFATPYNADNDQNTIERRIPLALHVHGAVEKSLTINTDRVFLGGFSGGSRVALRMAVAYPDIFRGALLMAGSDVLGERFPPPFSSQLMTELQSRSVLVYSTGQNDFENRASDGRSMASMKSYCLAGIRFVPQTRLEHWVPDGKGFANALNQLLTPNPMVPDKDCLDRLDTKVKNSIAAVRAELALGKYDSATRMLDQLDKKYGGLASPDATNITAEFPAR